MGRDLVGLRVSFVKNAEVITGIIVKVLERSVIIEISQEDADKIESPSTLTVVNHNYYKFLQK